MISLQTWISISDMVEMASDCYRDGFVSSTRDKKIEENYLFIHAYALNVNHKIYYFACNKIRCK